jgi:hypothetical protein
VALCRSCVNRRFGADFSTLKMEAIRSSETSVDTSSTQSHIPEDDILHSHRCESLISYIYMHVCYLDCHEAGLCCYVMIHIENLLRPLQSQSQSQSYFTTGGLPPISSSWRQAPWESRPEIFFQLNLCGNSRYVTSSLTRRWVCLSLIPLAFRRVYVSHLLHVIGNSH